MSLKSADYYRSELEANRMNSIASKFESELKLIEDSIDQSVSMLKSNICIKLTLSNYNKDMLMGYLDMLGYKVNSSICEYKDPRTYELNISW